LDIFEDLTSGLKEEKDKSSIKTVTTRTGGPVKKHWEKCTKGPKGRTNQLPEFTGFETRGKGEAGAKTTAFKQVMKKKPKLQGGKPTKTQSQMSRKEVLVCRRNM